jgi:hypothetical protein
MSEEEGRYRQLGLFSLIVAEMVVSPCLLGGLAFWLLRDSSLRVTVTLIAAMLGLVIAFYRISNLRRRVEKNDA